MTSTTASTTPALCWFDQVDRDDAALVGGKCASLGELVRAGVRVAPGFAVTTRGHAWFMARTGMADEVHRMVDELRDDDDDRLEAAGATIRAMIESIAFPAQLEDDIADHYQRLSDRCLTPAVPVAVRSSATAEDLPGASFAGLLDTYLGICGASDLIVHVRRCMASLFSARVLSYCRKLRLPHRDIGMGVGVQQLVAASVAGVMFTVNAEDGDRSVIAIDASFGLGEAVVSGTATPDHFLVNKVTLEIFARTIACKPRSIAFDRSIRRCVEMAIPADRRTTPALVDAEIVELCRVARLIEQRYGRPMDIEWAIDRDLPGGENIFIMQARPETVWSERRTEPPATSGDALDLIVQSLLAGHRLTRGPGG